MKKYELRSVWFDAKKKKLCTIDGEIPSVLPDVGYRVTYFGEHKGTSLYTDYIKKHFIALNDFLTKHKEWQTSDNGLLVVKNVDFNTSCVEFVLENKFEASISIDVLISEYTPVFEPKFIIGKCYTLEDNKKIFKLMDIGKKYLVLNYNGYSESFVLSINEGKNQLTMVDFSELLSENDLMVNEYNDFITIENHDTSNDTVDVTHHDSGITSKYTCFHILSKYKKTDKRLFLDVGELWGNRDNQYWVDSVYKDTNTKEILYVHCKLAKNTSKIVVLTADDFFNNHNKLDLHKILKHDALFYRNGVANEGCIVNDYTITFGVDGIPVHEITFNTFNRYKSNEISPEKHVTGDLYSFFEIYELRCV